MSYNTVRTATFLFSSVIFYLHRKRTKNQQHPFLAQILWHSLCNDIIYPAGI